MRLTWIMLVAGLVAAAVVVSPAGAAQTTCTGTITQQTIDGNVIVPANAGCTLLGVHVNGNVTVKDGGSLFASTTSCSPPLPGCLVGSQVLGNVVATGAADVDMIFSGVGGNLVVSQSGGVSLIRASVLGTATLTGNGRVDLSFMGVGGNLVCTNNDSVNVASLSTVGVGGQALGQCAGAHEV